MAAANGFKAILEFDEDNVYRSFEGWEETSYGRALKAIWKDEGEYVNRIARAFTVIHGTADEDFKKTWRSVWGERDQAFVHKPLPWYLAEFFRTIYEGHSMCRGRFALFSEYRITIKACWRHYLYLLEGCTDAAKRESGRSWELIHPPFFQETTPPKGEEDSARARGLADTVLLLAPRLVDLKGEVIDLMGWFDIKLDCTVERATQGKAEVALSATVSAGKEISLPPHQRSTLVSSANVRSAVEALNHAWHNQTARSVLLSASPGSGKEVLFELLCAALRVQKTDRIEVSAPTLREFTNLVELMKPEGARHQGLELYPNESLLFLDEIHHKEAAAIRTGLLRTMETDIARTMDGHVIRCDNLLYVLASSFLPPALAKVNPPDLWTRIEHNVVLEDPLLVDEDDRLGVLVDYFEFFWRNQVRSWDAADDRPPTDAHEFFLERKREMARELSDQLRDPSVLAKVFAERMLASRSKVSIRVVRSFVKRLFEQTVAYRRVQQRPHGPIADDEELEKEFGKWVSGLFAELVPPKEPSAS